MSSITARTPQLQEGANNSPITSFRYAFNCTPDTIRRMDREQLLQLCLEQLYILTIILAILRNPLAAVSTRVVAIDLFLSAIEKNIKRKVKSITERSRIYITNEWGIAARLGIHPNTASKSLKNLETYQMIKRNYTDFTLDNGQERAYLDVTLTGLTTTPQRLQDKTIRKMAEAGKKKKQKTPDGTVSPATPPLTCPSCGEDEQLQVTCKNCGTTGDIEEFTEGPQGDEAAILRAEFQAAATASFARPEEPDPSSEKIAESTLSQIPEQNDQPEAYSTNFVEYSNNAPQMITQLSSPGATIAAWLGKRIGREKGARIIWATGSPTSEKKYMAKPANYQPDLRKYIKGDREHIYGSYLGRPDGTTYVLSFDFDTNEADLDSQHEDLLKQCAAAGGAPIYWQRQNQRGHFELYFSEPVNANQAYAWAISVCPPLAKARECYPANDKQNSPISWPLWQRKGDEVLPCQGRVVFAKTDQVIVVDPTRRAALARVIEQAVTPANLIPAAPDPEPPEPAARGATAQMSLNFDQPEGSDIAKVVIEEFNRTTTWDELVARCGGYNRDGKFTAIWRGERTPSCKVDADERAACDYGRIGNWPKKFDKYQLWCWLEGVDKRADLARRCQAYRDRQEQAGLPEKPAAPRELDQVEPESIDQADQVQEISDDPEIQAILEVSAFRETAYTPATPCTKCGCTFTYNLAGSRACCLCYPFRGMSDLALYERMKAYSVKVRRNQF